jgi:hypothetical protein
MTSAQVSPDGRYLFEANASGQSVFDLGDGGRRTYSSSPGSVAAGQAITGWAGDHEIVTYHERSAPPAAGPVPPEGHDPVYQVRSPDFSVVQEAPFVLPADPHGKCATFPYSWAPRQQIPGAFVP